MADSASQSVVDCVQRLGKASGVLTVQETRELASVCEVAKETLLRGAQGLVEEASGRPILTSKSCDGTPLSVVHRSSRKLQSGRSVRTTGRQGQEFLLQNQFLRVDMGAQGWQTKVLLSEAQALRFGKSVVAIMAASRQHWRSLRQMGHLGCAVEHYVFDRFAISLLERNVREWHAVQEPPPAPAAPDRRSRTPLRDHRRYPMCIARRTECVPLGFTGSVR